MRPTKHVPELLSPAGNWDCVSAAIENGADAVYFGLDCGFNARHRAANFGLDDLDPLMETLRLRGVRGYVTLNTLVFPNELERVIPVIEAICRSGVDAVLVQDFGVARLVNDICDSIEIHASTQMSLTSAETIEVARDLKLSRAVLPRELSIREIQDVCANSPVPVECFIHGALCVAYSGQCLTSESLGGRSANRGQCAQACRLPYELVVDGADRDLGSVRYLLSPQDLAGYAAIPELVEAGVASLKIEGRLKTPEYVANITQHYRAAIDQAVSEGCVRVSDEERQNMELSFSRGFTPGWLEGNNHKRLVPGLRSAKQGIRLGTVLKTQRGSVLVKTNTPIRLGDGLAIACQDNDDSWSHGHEDTHVGGRVYQLRLEEDADDVPVKEAQVGQRVWIGFQRDAINWSKIDIGASVFKTDDPQLNRRLNKSFGGPPRRLRDVNWSVRAATGEVPCISATLSDDATVTHQWRGTESLSVAKKHPITPEVLQEKLSRTGGTPFCLGTLETSIHGKPLFPLGLINEARRVCIDQLTQQLQRKPHRTVDATVAYDRVLGDDRHLSRRKTPSDSASLFVLCRTQEQLEAALELGVGTRQGGALIADFHHVKEHRQAVQSAHRAGAKIYVASVRMQKPREMGFLKQLHRQGPDGVLARNLAALRFASENGLPAIADSSLNAANGLSVRWLQECGAATVTASLDLDAGQLVDLADTTPASGLHVVVHQHMPLFHMEHCVFCAVLSPGTNKTNCGRPCDRHSVEMRDRAGAKHPLEADIACRNTLFNAKAQSGADIVERLVARGTREFRVELLREDAHQTRRMVSSYLDLLAGRISAVDLVRRLSVSNRVGVTPGLNLPVLA
ncbi:MAG: DUF3656 domain-containing protein [Planctomycetota bacterium]